MGKTSIEWAATANPDGSVTAGETWNPVRGCTKVSPGCANCYAETFAERWRGVPEHAYEQGFDLRLVPDKLDEPLRRKKPTTYFVNSMSDLFHEGVPDDYIDHVFAVMALVPRHTFQVLTKRAERMREYVSAASERWGDRRAGIELAMYELGGDEDARTIIGWPLPNVWLGVSVENQHFADARIPLLLQTPAAVRFISAEPLLERILLDNGESSWLSCTSKLTADEYEAMTSAQRREIDEVAGNCCESWVDHGQHFHGIDWVIVGGESGHGARPLWVPWVRSIVQQCKAGHVACFVKQLGANVRDRNDAGFTGDGEGPSWPDMDPDDIDEDLDGTRDGYQGAPVRVHLRSRKGGDPAEWPEDLRVREMPAVTR